MIVPLSDIPN